MPLIGAMKGIRVLRGFARSLINPILARMVGSCCNLRGRMVGEPGARSRALPLVGERLMNSEESAREGLKTRELTLRRPLDHF